MDTNNTIPFTGQGSGSPVPVGVGSERVGSSRPLASDHSVPVVMNQATAQTTATGTEEREDPHRRISGIPRKSPEVKVKSLRMSKPTAKSEVSKKKVQEITKLGQQLEELLAYITPRNNVHGEIKKKVNLISLTYKRLLKLEEKLNAESESPKVLLASIQMASTQTSPRNSDEAVESLTLGDEQQPTLRNDNLSLLDEGEEAKKVCKEHTGTKKSLDQPPTQIDQTEVISHEWQNVQHKKMKNKQRGRATLPNALIIKKKGDLSYAEILSKVKKDTSLQEVGKGVDKIRRTMAGDIILVLDKASQEKTAQFQTAVETVLGMDASVTSKVQEATIEIKDLDGVTTKKEIVAALSSALDGRVVKLNDVKSIRKTYGDTQTAMVTLPVEAANKVTKMGKLRIGWVVCRVREHIKPMKCYKCWQYGHWARVCNSLVDWSKCCVRCGIEGHMAKKCISDPCCVLCKDSRNKEQSKHSAGSSRCPAFMKAYQLLLRKRR